MSFTLMPYQQDALVKIRSAWDEGAQNVMPVLPTGAGKTVIMGSDAHSHDGYGCSIAHRSELVGQISMALAREGVEHDVIGPDSLVRNIVGAQMREFGRKFYNARARWKVASVNTLANRAADLPRSWVSQVTRVHGDEGHHYLLDNIWGRAVQIFHNARGMFPTATPIRGDKKGLGRAPLGSGIIDALVEGPGMRWLIDNVFLTDYRLIAAGDIDMTGVAVSSSTGDFSQTGMRKRVKENPKIVGDIVEHYFAYANGLKGITFAVDIDHATEIANKFKSRGVRAEVISSKTPDAERDHMMLRFKDGDLDMLVNVDLFGEGVDVPAVQVVIMARPTLSYSLYVQQFGRALRLLVSPILRAAWHTYTVEQRAAFVAESIKPRAIIIDHVGNVFRHKGPPDMRWWDWDLSGRKSQRDDGIPMRACANKMCLAPFQRIYPSCPYCGWTPDPPADRSHPEFVDGDLTLYTPEMLRELWGKKQAMDADRPAIPYNMSDMVIAGIKNRHANNQAAQAALRQTMALVTPPGVDERVNNRRFYHTFGIDTLAAQSLPSREATELRQKILDKLRGGQ